MPLDTGPAKRDHLTYALWRGEFLDINEDPLSDHADPEADIVPNTHPMVTS
jgi:aromatic ring-cleaving dioxygenase